MVYLVVLLSLWLAVSALTALRPGRSGLFGALAFPVGWAASELPVQAIVVQAALLGLLAWWGWTTTAWLSVLVLVLATVSIAENIGLIVVQLLARRIVRRSLAESPQQPLRVGRLGDDAFGTWWRTMLQIPLHPRAMQSVRDIAYGPFARNRLDVWRLSTTPRGAPVLFYIHGGAWTFGDKTEQARPMLHEFVARGWVVVTANYRLAPASPWPAQIEDVTRVLGWIKKNIANYGGDPDRVVIAGGSAGGHLAALTALEHDDSWRSGLVRDVRDWSVRGCISFYGVLEMTGDEQYWNGRGAGLRLLLEHRVVQRRYVEHVELYEQISPLHRLRVDAPPFLVFQGGNDTLVDVQVARSFVSSFRRQVVAPIYYVELPLTQHAFDLTASVRTSATTRAAVAFAESVAARRPDLGPTTLAAYQSPPVQILVTFDGVPVDASTAAETYGTCYIVTADNPYSRRGGDDVSERRSQLERVVARLGIAAAPSVSRDPSGHWPDEIGVALFGTDEATARALATLFDQFALYEVGTSTRVVPVRPLLGVGR